MLKQKLQLPYSGLFSQGAKVPSFPNGFTIQENLFLTADCFRRLDCGIKIFGILAHV